MDDPNALLDGTRTPPELFAALNRIYRFDWDLFASAENSLRGHYRFTKEQDAFARTWHGVPNPNEQWSFANPPYSRGNLERYVRKAIAEAKLGAKTVGLIPATPGTEWFNGLLLRPCDMLGAWTVDEPETYANGSKVLSGYCLSMAGTGYRQKVTFLKGRVPFLSPIGWPEDRPWNPPSTDSILLELSQIK